MAKHMSKGERRQAKREMLAWRRSEKHWYEWYMGRSQSVPWVWCFVPEKPVSVPIGRWARIHGVGWF